MSSPDDRPGIFISYRRDDAPAHAGRLHERLSRHFGEPHVFIDVDSIPLGTDFVSALENALASCQVMLVLIGPSWLSASSDTGQRRLDDPDDYVRIEVQAALDRGIAVVPVLVQGSSLPNADDLPVAIRSLVRRQAFELRDDRFKSDATLLLERLEREVATMGGRGPSARSQATVTPTTSSADALSPAARWQATCQKTGRLKRRFDVRLTSEAHVIEYWFRRTSEVRVDGHIAATYSILDGARSSNPMSRELFDFALSDGHELRGAQVDVDLSSWGIRRISLTVDGHEIASGAWG